MVEAVVRHDAHMSEPVKKYQRTKSEAFVTLHRHRGVPEASRTLTLEVHPGILKHGPYEAGAIVSVRAGRSIEIRNSEPRKSIARCIVDVTAPVNIDLEAITDPKDAAEETVFLTSVFSELSTAMRISWVSGGLAFIGRESAEVVTLAGAGESG